MKRIFLTLSLAAHLTVLCALILGVRVGDPMTAGGLDPEINSRIGTHMLIGLAALTCTTMVHALQFTYFMGTGRWIEETSIAYSLAPEWHQTNQRIKYGMLPGICVSFLLIVATGCFGAVADPATPVTLEPLLKLSDSTLHFLIAGLTWFVTGIVNVLQYVAISRNSVIVEGVLAEVRRIRLERGLPVE